MSPWTENCVTLVVMAALILGLFYMSHSWHSMWWALLLLNLHYQKK